MTAVERLYDQSQPQSRALRRIRLLSLPFEITFAGVALLELALLALLLVCYVASDGQAVRLHPGGGEFSPFPGDWARDAAWPPGSVAVGDLPLIAQIYGVGVLSIVFGCQIAAFFSFSRLFAACRRGVVFADTTMAWMRRAGGLLLVSAVAPAALQPVTHALGLQEGSWIHQTSVTALIVGGALFVLAYVIELGREIEAEGKGYV